MMTRTIQTKITQPNTLTGNFHLLKLQGKEELSSLYQLQLKMLYDGEDFTPDKLIKQSLNIEISDAGGLKRYFDGIVWQFAKIRRPTGVHYKLTMVPKLYLLQFRVNNRVFQSKNQTLLTIVQQLLKEHEITCKVMASGNFPALEYCVQYQESDFAFISRLLEQAGIFYYFEHTANGHTLVLANNTNAYNASIEDAQLCGSNNMSGIEQWSMDYQFASGKWIYNRHDYEKPKNTFIGNSQAPADALADVQYESYEYGAFYPDSTAGEALAKLRVEEQLSNIKIGRGKSTYCNLSLASTFNFDANQMPSERGNTYVITKLKHEITNANLANETGLAYSNSMRAINANVIFRPKLSTPIPQAPSTQLATIVGAENAEIATDEYGRYQVQFYWNRGDSNANSKPQPSCWIRSVQHWEGFLRVGTPVVIGFIDGDLNQPIILGPVYNADLKPLYAAQVDQNKSSLKRRFTTSDTEKTYNEIIFNDKADNQLMSVNASKDMEVIVVNNFSQTIQKGTYVLKIKGNVTIQTDGELLIDAEKAITMKSKDTITIDAGKDLILKGSTIKEN